jgi:hypothetical protein
MGLSLSRLVLKVSTALFFMIGALYFLKGDSWPAKRTKATGIILVILMFAMIISLLTGFWIAGLYN